MDDIYKGTIKKLNIQLSGPCSCRTHCQKCNGEGKIQMVQMIGPFQQVIQTQCSECNGEGRSKRKSDCKECNKEGNYTKSEHVTIDIPRATTEDWTYRVKDLGYQPIHKNELPGDIVIRLKAEEHYFFTREANHLVTRCSVSMKEAICGTIIECPHFGGSFLIDTSTLGVLEKGKKYIIKEKGLTTHDDLFIYFNVEYPKLTNEKRNKI